MPEVTTNWTPADQAELDVLLWELSDAYFDHRPNCAQCRASDNRDHGATPCEHLTNAISIVLGWRERRRLLTRAQNARAQLEERAA